MLLHAWPRRTLVRRVRNIPTYRLQLIMLRQDRLKHNTLELNTQVLRWVKPFLTRLECGPSTWNCGQDAVVALARIKTRIQQASYIISVSTSLATDGLQYVHFNLFNQTLHETLGCKTVGQEQPHLQLWPPRSAEIRPGHCVVCVDRPFAAFHWRWFVQRKISCALSFFGVRWWGSIQIFRKFSQFFAAHL